MESKKPKKTSVLVLFRAIGGGGNLLANYSKEIFKIANLYGYNFEFSWSGNMMNVFVIN